MILLLSLITLLPMETNPPKMALLPQLRDFITARPSAVPEEPRKSELDALAEWIRERQQAGEPAPMVFICTHNSRRSHVAQIWMAAMARYYGLDHIQTYSGGTEATAFNPRAVASMRRSGFVIGDAGGRNPQYAVWLDGESAPLICFSKRYDHPANPSVDFAAVMVCSDADEACPVVVGASVRIALPYLDPKASDGRDDEAQTYDLRSRQIAAEMKYLAEKASIHD
jgi:arsenate reductase (thioredoxin)